MVPGALPCGINARTNDVNANTSRRKNAQMWLRRSARSSINNRRQMIILGIVSVLTL
uniref:Uncharacterized protein n=1 Tax=Arion vulgaris TaxID=1028688 RepID=A0A0B6Y7Z1_9EUPU